MSRVDVKLPQREKVARFLATSRTDRWYIQPLLVLFGLTTFGIYATWAAFQAEHYFVHAGGAHYLSPFYSPLLYGHAGEPFWIGGNGQPGWWPGFLPYSPAFLILMGPGAMRLTCYYYRGAYYKSFWGSPPNCGVGGPHGGRYTGESRFPLIMQNIHRYVFYPAAAFVMVLAYDAYKAMWFVEDGTTHFGIGVGTIFLAMNAFLLGGYTFGCHCARHQIGGYLNVLSKHKVRSKCYSCVSSLNRGHMRWAWVSLVWVGLTDLYVRLLSMGVIIDFRLF